MKGRGISSPDVSGWSDERPVQEARRPAMNVLLLYPRFPETFWGFRNALKFVRRKAALPPLGLLTVGAMLPQSWSKRLVDENVRGLTTADLAWADVVFVSAMIVQRDSVRALLARCRAAGKTIVAGGPLFTAEHAQFPEVDHFVLNEAEATLVPFLRDLATGTARRVYTSAEYPDLSTSPIPLWELAGSRDYHSMSIQFSRGCSFDCEFCNVTALFGHHPRTKRPAQVIAELDALYRWGWRGAVFFVDDNFIGNKREARERLLPALIAWQRGKHGISFYTQASINLADDDVLMDAMVEAGFRTVFVGIETPDDAGLAECDKRQNLGRDLVGDVKRIQRAGLQVQGGFIIGFDSDTPTIFQRQLEFIERSGIVVAMVGLLNAAPQTRLYERLKREGRLLGEMTGDNVDGTTNFVPRMNAEVLRQGHREVLRQLYAPGAYYRRARAFLREVRSPKVPLSLDWRNLWAFGYSSLRLGIIGRERFHYWHLLFWALLRRPALVREVVTLAICGHHFRRTSGALRA
jgi:radical SAM superfamily enzyme YgiQ (UPF0313 family)